MDFVFIISSILFMSLMFFVLAICFHILVYMLLMDPIRVPPFLSTLCVSFSAVVTSFFVCRCVRETPSASIRSKMLFWNGMWFISACTM